MSLLLAAITAFAVVHTSAVAAAVGLTPTIVAAISDAAVKAYAAGAAASAAAGAAVTGGATAAGAAASAAAGAAVTGGATAGGATAGGVTAGGVCAGTAPVCAAIAATVAVVGTVAVANPGCTWWSSSTRVTAQITFDNSGKVVSVGRIQGVSDQYFPTCSSPANLPLVGGYIADYADWHCTWYVLPKNDQVAKAPFVYEYHVEDVCFQVTSNKVDITQRDGWKEDPNKNGETLVTYYVTSTTPSTILRQPVLEGWEQAVEKHVFSGKSLADMRKMVDDPSSVPAEEVAKFLENYLGRRKLIFGYVLEGTPPLVVRNCRSE